MRIQRCDATLGAVITDVCVEQLDDDRWTAIERAFHDHAVLVFPGQHLTHEAQVAFARRFGAIEHIVGDRGWVSITNVDGRGHVRPPDGPQMEIVRGNMGWHTDSSYKPLAAKASMLSAHVVPSSGGETEWADMRDAHDALDEHTRAAIARLSAHHSLAYSQARAGFADRSFAYGFDDERPPLRPLVKMHPATGRPALFIGRHAHAVPGLSPEDSEELLDRLLDHACRSPRILRHRWQVGDLVVWDNRCVLHRARPWDLREPRTMVHTRVAGDPATELV
jgi:alpha-ketoglutarate-dependent taurine dioxygenase